MYKNSIGIIYQLTELLDDGLDKLIDLGIDCVQIQCWTQELLTEENAEKAKSMLDGKISFPAYTRAYKRCRFCKLVGSRKHGNPCRIYT